MSTEVCRRPRSPATVIALGVALVLAVTGCTSGEVGARRDATATAQGNLRAAVALLREAAEGARSSSQLRSAVEALPSNDVSITDVRGWDEGRFSAATSPIRVALLRVSGGETVSVDLYAGAMVSAPPFNQTAAVHGCVRARFTPGDGNSTLQPTKCPAFPGYLNDGEDISASLATI